MSLNNIMKIVRNYEFSIYKILYYELFFRLRGFKGNKINFATNNEFTENIPCPYYFLVKIKKFIKNKNIKSFLDLGCGNGRVVYFFNKYFKIKYYVI